MSSLSTLSSKYVYELGYKLVYYDSNIKHAFYDMNEYCITKEKIV